MLFRQNQLVWINGPFLASKHDITIFWKPGGLKTKIPPGKRTIGNSGYQGKPDHVAVRNSLDTEAVNKFKNRVRACHKTLNGRINFFNLLDTKNCHGHEKHKIAFKATSVIMQYNLENGHPLFAV
jgi:hypothetical protein